MLKTGILNPQILSLIARVRHTNTLVIADRGFPYWPMIETVDISLVDDIPTVLQVFEALKANFVVGQIYMAEEFKAENTLQIQQTFADSRGNIPISFEPHVEFGPKQTLLLPGAIRASRFALWVVSRSPHLAEDHCFVPILASFGALHARTSC